MEGHLLRDLEHRVEAVHHHGVQRRGNRADAEGVGGEHQVLARGNDRVGPAGRHCEGKDDGGHVADLVGEPMAAR